MNDPKRETPAAGQHTGEAFDTTPDYYSTVAQSFCSGYGQHHSPNADNNPRPLITCTLSDIEAMLIEPPSLAKSSAQWFIPSTMLSRVHAEQRVDGAFWALWADIDEPNGLTLRDLVQAAEPFRFQRSAPVA